MKISINNPCQASWEAMSGDEQKRFCSQCQKHVYHLSAMTKKQATEVLSQVEEPCVRYTIDRSNQVHVTSPRRNSWLLAASMLAFGCNKLAEQPPAVQPAAQQQSTANDKKPSILSALWERFQAARNDKAAQQGKRPSPKETQPKIVMGKVTRD